MGKIELTGADNARDLGGIRTMDGAVIKEGYLIRSNRLSRITQRDTKILSHQYHLHKIIDLRTPMEIDQEADLKVPGAVYMNIPFFLESMVGISHEKKTKRHMMHMDDIPKMTELYKMMIQKSFCRKQIAKALNEIIAMENGSVLWHCTEGKDRCGLLSAMVLSLLDVSKEDIMEDYLKTNHFAARRIEKIQKKFHNMGFHREKIERMEGLFLAKEEYLQAAFDVMEEQNHSVSGFLKESLGISEEQKNRLKEKVLA